MHTREPKKLELRVEKKGEIKASDITPDAVCEILNPDLHLCTLNAETKLNIELVNTTALFVSEPLAATVGTRISDGAGLFASISAGFTRATVKSP